MYERWKWFPFYSFNRNCLNPFHERCNSSRVSKWGIGISKLILMNRNKNGNVFKICSVLVHDPSTTLMKRTKNVDHIQHIQKKQRENVIPEKALKRITGPPGFGSLPSIPQISWSGALPLKLHSSLFRTLVFKEDNWAENGPAPGVRKPNACDDQSS